MIFGKSPKYYSLVLTHIVGVIALSVSPLSYSAEDTLLDIYALAKENDHQLKSDHAEFLAAKEAAAINRSELRPQIIGTADLSRTHTDTSGTTPQETEADQANYGVSLTQALIDFSALSTYRQGKIQAQAAAINYEADQQSLIIRTAQAYFNVLRAVDQLQTATAEKKAQATLLEQTRQRYEVGLISINDVHEAQAAYDSSVANEINSEASVGIQHDTLTVLTGEFHTDIAPLKDDFNAVPLTPNNKQDWIEFALKNNIALKVSELNAEAARFAAKSARNEFAPTLNGTISYNQQNQDTDVEGSGDVNSDSGTAVFRLNLRVPLYTGGNLSARQRQAEQTAIQNKETFLFTQRQTVQSTRSLFLSVTTDIAQIKARKQAIVSNEAALDATRAGYDAGTRDIVDVVNAQRNLFQAQRDYFDALYDYIINTLLLKEAAGNLQVSDLELLESTLKK